MSPIREGRSLISRRAGPQCRQEKEVSDPELTQLLGWSVSALLHGLVLAVVAGVHLQVALQRVTPQKESFRWNVSLVTAPPTEAVVADNIQPQEDFQFAETYPGNRGDAVEAVVSHSREPSDQAEIGQPQKLPQRTQQALSLPEDPSRMNEKFGMATAMRHSRFAASALPPPDVESPADSKSVQIETELERPVVLQRPQSVIRTLVHKAVLPNYGWLMDQLRSNLEQVKTYPAIARANHWQGRVVVQVSIEEDGRIANPVIEESSGHSMLDRAALEALQEASPLTLKHRLESSSVVMLVPLNYQLE